ncbi:MAG: hypothetical protein AAGL69_17620 [Pseudomonadota bacterium]
MKLELRTRLTIFAAGTVLALVEIALAGLWQTNQPVSAASCDLVACVSASNLPILERIEE